MTSNLARRIALVAVACALAAWPLPAASQPASTQRTFSSPKDAIQALRAAVDANDETALGEIFGPDYADLKTGDSAQDVKDLRGFSASSKRRIHPREKAPGLVVLEIGRRRWPFPIPLVRAQDGWRFDVAAGKEELLDRRIGKDELDAIGACRAFAKDSGRHRRAFGEKPVHGYIFKVLTVRGSSTSGAALLAYPEEWDRSGVMTFMVGRDGVVYRRDLGDKTAQLAAAMTEFAPDASWQVEKDRGTPVRFRQGRD